MVNIQEENAKLEGQLAALVGDFGLAHLLRALGTILADHNLGWREEDGAALDANVEDYNGESAKDLKRQTNFLIREAHTLQSTLIEKIADSERIA
jgi:hypothetical protein